MKHLSIKKFLLAISTIIFFSAPFFNAALAVTKETCEKAGLVYCNASCVDKGTLCEPIGEIKLVSPINLPKVNDLASLIELLVNILKYLSWAIAPVLYVYAAFQIMASGGDPKKVQDGYKTIIWTTVGLVVLLIASSLPNLIKNLLGVS